MSLAAISPPTIPQEGGGSQMSCLQEALDGGHPTIDQRIYQLRMSVKIHLSYYYHKRENVTPDFF